MQNGVGDGRSDFVRYGSLLKRVVRLLFCSGISGYRIRVRYDSLL